MALSTEERNNIVEDLRQQYPIEDQCSFNEFNINDKLMENTQLYVQYKQLYEHECFVLSQLQEKMDILKGNLYDQYKFESDRNLTKTEIEQYYIPGNKKFLKMKKILEKQEIKVQFFKLCVDSVEKLYWRAKEWLKSEG